MVELVGIGMALRPKDSRFYSQQKQQNYPAALRLALGPTQQISQLVKKNDKAILVTRHGGETSRLTFSRQSAHGWREDVSFMPFAMPGRFLVLISVKG
jgi:hypothetical protein